MFGDFVVPISSFCHFTNLKSIFIEGEGLVWDEEGSWVLELIKAGSSD
jgi:hypothetical protein